MPAGPHIDDFRLFPEETFSLSENSHALPDGKGFSRLAPLIQAAINEELKTLQCLIAAAKLSFERQLIETSLLTREQTAKLLNLSVSQVDKLARRGEIPTTYIDSRPRFPLGPIQEFVRSRTTRKLPLNLSKNSKTKKA